MRFTVVGISATSNVAGVDRRDGQADAVERRPSPWGRRTSSGPRGGSSVSRHSLVVGDLVRRASRRRRRGPGRSGRRCGRRRAGDRSTWTSSPALSRPRFVLSSVSWMTSNAELARRSLGDGQADAVDRDALAVATSGQSTASVSRRNFGPSATPIDADGSLDDAGEHAGRSLGAGGGMHGRARGPRVRGRVRSGTRPRSRTNRRPGSTSGRWFPRCVPPRAFNSRSTASKSWQPHAATACATCPPPIAPEACGGRAILGAARAANAVLRTGHDAPPRQHGLGGLERARP